MQKIRQIPNPDFKIEYNTSISYANHRTVQSDPEIIRVIMRCLDRDPKRRSTIPALLNDTILKSSSRPLSTGLYIGNTEADVKNFAERVVETVKRKGKSVLNSEEMTLIAKVRCAFVPFARCNFSTKLKYLLFSRFSPNWSWAGH